MATLSALLNLGRNIPLLSTTNADDWSNWKEDVLQMVLSADGQSAKIATGLTSRPSEAADAKEWDRLNSQAASIIKSLTNRDCRNIYKDKTNASEIWSALVSYFEKSSFSSRSATRAAYHRITHDPLKPTKVYLDALDDMRARLQALLPSGETISDSYHKDIMLQNLHSSFEAWKTSLLAQPTGEPNLKTCRTVLESAMVSFDPEKRADEILDGINNPSEPSSRVEAAHAYATAFRKGSKGGSRNGSGTRESFSGRGGGRGGASNGSGHEDGQGFIDSRGNRWCDMSMDGCHRCGGMSHKASNCVKDMPEEVKHWCLNRTYDTAHITHNPPNNISSHFIAPIDTYGFSAHPTCPPFEEEEYIDFHA